MYIFTENGILNSILYIFSYALLNLLYITLFRVKLRHRRLRNDAWLELQKFRWKNIHSTDILATYHVSKIFQKKNITLRIKNNNSFIRVQNYTSVHFVQIKYKTFIIITLKISLHRKTFKKKIVKLLFK